MEKAVVVSLINQHERRQHIDSLFDEHNINFRYFNAINKQQSNEVLQKYALKVRSQKISEGEIACYLSHYCLWKQVVQQDLPYLMVFEDDIYFSENTEHLLNNLDWLPGDFDVVKLETMYCRVMIDKGIDLTSKHKLCQMRSSHMGMAGYIISQKGAKKLLAMTQELGVDRPVDHIMFDFLIKQNKSKVYQVSPALCIQDKIHNENTTRFDSCLEQERQLRPVVKVKLLPAQKLSRELNRVWSQMRIVNFSRSLLLIVKGYKKQRVEYKE